MFTEQVTKAVAILIRKEIGKTVSDSECLEIENYMRQRFGTLDWIPAHVMRHAVIQAAVEVGIA